MSSNKQYGLQIPKKNIQSMVQKHSVFGDDSNSDKSDGGGSDWLKKSLKREHTQSVHKKQTKLDIQRALEQDATVYQYDEIYDQMDHQRQNKMQKDKDRKPRYIQKLLVTAEKRKVENERRIERQVQKEREAEGEEFKDKETFVTSAYKKKLEEFAKLDAEQKRQDMLEDIGDVTKQQDISGFYRHLYQTTVSPIKEASEQPESSTKDVKGSNENKTPKDPKKDKRQYRKRKDSESSTEKNKDADTEGASSSSSSSSSESESDDEKSSESETEDPKRIRLKEYAEIKSESSTTNVPSVEKKTQEKGSPVLTEPTPQPVASLPAQNEIPAIDIWEKRTVGAVFDAAYKRYLERKQARMTAVH